LDTGLELAGAQRFDLDIDPDMDEDSDAEDPERAANEKVRELQEAANEQNGFLEAVRGALECRAVLTDLERARMQLEDLRGIR
jgi:hypothetical protein